MTGSTQVLAGFDILPDELLVRTVDHLDRADLARVRLVSQRLNLISTEKLFERVTLYAHWAREDECAKYVHDEDIEQDAVQLTSDDGEQSPEEVFPRGARGIPNEPNDGVFENNVASENEQDATDDEIAVDGRSPHMVEKARTVQPSDGFALERDRSNSVRSDFSGQTTEVGEYERNLTDRENSSNRVPQWATDGFPGPLGYDAQSLKNILQHEILRNHVREVQVYTCETHCDHHPSLSDAWFDGGWPRPTYHPVYIECIKRLNSFPNLRALTVHFDRHKGDDYQDDTLQDPHFQKTWLERIIRSNNGRVTELAIRHYENPGLKEGMMLHYKPVLMQNTLEVTSLRLSIKHEETSPDSGPVYRCGDIHPFWDSFPKLILEPLQRNLRTLVLYSDLPLGWFPKLDLRSIHLPALRSLTLGHHIFCHNHQIDWVVSHQETLKELYLDHCAILCHIGHSIPEWLDEEGYPKRDCGQHIDYGWSQDPIELEDDFFLDFTPISLRWYEIFHRFAAELKNLHTFKFGSSKQWKFDTSSRYDERGGGYGPLPIMPWEDEHNIENQVTDGRYVIWDDWQQEYRSRWKSNDEPHQPLGLIWRDNSVGKFESYPDCETEDKAALRALLSSIRGR